MNIPLIVAGSLGVLGAAIHGAGGELLVMRRLEPGTLPPSPFGGARMTQAMIHVTWHMTTIAFLTVGVALLVSGSALEGDAAQAVAVFAAGAAAGFAALAVGLGAVYMRSPRHLLRHPGPTLLTAVAVLAWWGALSA